MKKRAKPKATPKPEPARDIPARIEGCWINEQTGEVLLRISTGGYRGEWGAFCEKTVDVHLRGEE